MTMTGHDLKWYYWWKESGYQIVLYIFPDGEGCRININPQPFEGAVSSTWLVKPLELGACVGSRMVGCLVVWLKSKESRSLLTLSWSSFFSMHFFFQTTWIYAMWHFWIPLAVSMVVYHVEFTRWPTSEMLLGQFGSLASWDSWDVASCACCDSWDSHVVQLGEQEPMSPYQCEAMAFSGVEAGNWEDWSIFHLCIVKHHSMHGLGVFCSRVPCNSGHWQGGFLKQGILFRTGWALMFGVSGVRLWFSPCNCCESQGSGNWVYIIHVHLIHCAIRKHPGGLGISFP